MLICLIGLLFGGCATMLILCNAQLNTIKREQAELEKRIQELN